MAGPTIIGNTTPVAGLPTTSPVATAIGDMVICYTFERAGAGVPTHTVDTAGGFIEIRTVSHDDGSTDGRLSLAYKIATAGGANAYQAYTSSVGTETWTGCVVLGVGTFDLRWLVRSNGVTATGTGAPNPPAVLGLGLSLEYEVFALAAWHLSSGATVAVTPPTNYATINSLAGSNTAELAIASDQLTGIVSTDPGAWADDVTPNGTCGITFAVPGVPADDVFVKMIAIFAGNDNSGTTLATSASINVAVDDLIVVATRLDNTGAAVTVTITDNAAGGSNDYDQIAQELGTTDCQVTLHYAIAKARELLTVTQTLSGALDFRGLMVATYLNVDPDDPLDQAQDEQQGEDPEMTGFVPDTDDQLIVAAVGNFDGDSYGSFSPMVERLEDDAGFQLSDVIQTSAVLQGGDWSGGNTANACVMASFHLVSQGAAAYEVVADIGSYALTGTAAALQATQIFDAAGGSYLLTGTAASLEHGFIIAADGGSYALTGTAATLQATQIFDALGGSYALTGTAAALQTTRIFGADAGAYAIDGDVDGGTTLTKGDAPGGGGSSYYYNRKRRR